MAWTAPRTWADDEIVTTAYMNAQIRDNLLVLSTHAHGGSAGDGSATLASGISFSGLATATFADQSGNPAVAGRLQRNGNNLVYYNGSAVISLGVADAASGTASLRTLGTSSTTAAAGNHRFKISVTKAGVVTYQHIGAAAMDAGTLADPTARHALTFDDGDVIVPYIATLSDTATADSLFIKDITYSRTPGISYQN